MKLAQHSTFDIFLITVEWHENRNCGTAPGVGFGDSKPVSGQFPWPPCGSSQIRRFASFRHVPVTLHAPPPSSRIVQPQPCLQILAIPPAQPQPCSTVQNHIGSAVFTDLQLS